MSKVKVKSNPLLTDKEKQELCETCKKFYNIPSCDGCNIACWRKSNADSILHTDIDDRLRDALNNYVYHNNDLRFALNSKWEEYVTLKLNEAKANGCFININWGSANEYAGIDLDRIVELLLRWLDIPYRPRLWFQQLLLNKAIELGYELEYQDDRCNNEH